VELLQNWAAAIGITYEEINIWISPDGLSETVAGTSF
jgi:hypothetical protein